MIHNYLITIWRNLKRNKLFSFIHIMGLSLGLACALFLAIIIYEEYSFDRFHEKADRIYVLRKTIFMDAQDYTVDKTGDRFGDVLKETFPGIEANTRFRNPGELLFNITNKNGNMQAFLENEGAAVDSSFLSIFTFPAINGDTDRALFHDKSIVLTKKSAERFFGSTDVVGREILINQSHSLMVTAVLDDVLVHSTLQFDWLIPYAFLNDLGVDISHFEGTRTYNIMLMHESANVDEINSLLPDQIIKWYEPDIETHPFLTKFSDLHLYGETHNIEAIRVFIIFAILILMLASINYMNLSTARFTGRAKEVGVRKTFGANRAKLIWQFIGESILMTIIAYDIALLILELSLPAIGRYYEAELVIPYKNAGFILFSFALILITGFISGSYPAIILSSFSPVKVLKNPAFHGFKGFKLRTFLVIFQFAIAIVFILGSIFLYAQFQHLHNMDKGFRTEGMMYFTTKGKLHDNYTEFKNELLTLPGVENVTTMHSNPGFISLGEFEWGSIDENQKTLAHVCWTGLDFPETFDIKMQEGVFYDKPCEPGAERKIVINRNLADYLGLDNPIGQPFYLYHHRYKIIGIIDDFLFFPLSLSSKMLIIPFDEVSNIIYVALAEQNRENTIIEIENIYNKFNPSYPFDYYFQQDYKMPFEDGIENTLPLLWVITLLGIIISLMGLFGLTSYSTTQKTVEIGVRKAFGAETNMIVKQFIRQFIKPVIIGVGIGIIIAWLLLNWAFSLFIEPVSLNWWKFVLAGVAILVLALITVAGQSMSAASKNPHDCLKYE